MSVSAGQLLSKPGALQALLHYHMSSQVLLEPSAASGGSLPTLYNGKSLRIQPT